METPATEDLDDSINLESKVLLALSRLQNDKKRSKKRRKPIEVSCKKVVEFLKANYSWLDGDLESQVMTALLSCIKTGVVCALDTGKYRLVVPSSRTMASNCIARTSHGPKCCCLTMLKNTLKSNPRTCCRLKYPEASAKKKRKGEKGKGFSKPRSSSSPSSPSRRNLKKRSVDKNKCQVINCAMTAQKLFGTSKSSIALSGESTNTKCSYCLEIHSLPKSRKVCMTCYPFGAIHGVPYDKFSPRDELVSSMSLENA